MMMKTLARFGALLGCWFLLATSPVSGAVLDLELSSQIAQTGQPVSADIVISGVAAGGPPSVGAFDLEVAFDPTILSAPSITFGPFLGDPNGLEALIASSLSPAAVEIAEVSLLSPAALDTLQPGSFVLATLLFNGLTSGPVSLQFSRGVVDDAFGEKLVEVPEPATVLLLGAGLTCLAVAAWMRRGCSHLTARTSR
jgi:hypothetical protein